MEVSGKVATSEEDLTCLPCSLDGLKETVHGYCQDCQEHLCETCFKHHKKSRPTRYHILLDKEAMPKDQRMPNVKTNDETDYCTSHADKRLEFYCSKHKTIACYVCVTLGHKACDVDYIPDISGNISESDEFRNVIAQLSTIKETCETDIRQAHMVRDKIDIHCVKAIEELKQFRREINDCLDNIEAEIRKEIESLAILGKSKQTDINETCQEITEQVNDMESLLNRLNKDHQQNKLFIEMKKAAESLSYLKNKAKQTCENNLVSRFAFVRNQELTNLLKVEKLGTIVSSDAKEATGEEDSTVSGQNESDHVILPSEDIALNLDFIGTVDVKSLSDKTECSVNGIVLIPPQNIIVTDYHNKSVKLIDRERNTLISEIKLSSRPHDIIRLPQNKLVVSLADVKCIQFLSLTGTVLSTDSRVDVGEKCHGLAYCQDKLVMACGYISTKIVILNLAGNVLKAFDLPGLLSSPERVVVSKDNKYIYVSGATSWKNKFTKMDWEGNVLQTFQGKIKDNLYGIDELVDGTFLVCNSASNTIVRLSSFCKKCKVTGLEKANVLKPEALAYCEKQSKLYVSCASGVEQQANTVKVFDVKWT